MSIDCLTYEHFVGQLCLQPCVWRWYKIKQIRDANIISESWVRITGYICCAQRDFGALSAQINYKQALEIQKSPCPPLTEVKISVCFYLCGVVFRRLVKRKQRVKYIVDSLTVTPQTSSQYR